MGAVARLQEGGAALVIADGRAVAGRESEALGALRGAGAASVLVVFPPESAHRAETARGAGADAAITLPAYPGELLREARRLLARSAPRLERPDTDPPVLEPLTPTGEVLDEAVAPALIQPATTAVIVDDVNVESLIGDVAVINRSVGDLDRVLDQTVQLLCKRSGAGRCSILLRGMPGGEEELTVRKAVGVPREGLLRPAPSAEGVACHVARTGESLLVRDAPTFAREHPRLKMGRPERHYKTESFLVLPLRGSEGIIGVLCLTDKEDGEEFDRRDNRLVSFLAAHVGQCLENALRFRQLRDLSVIDELTGLYNRRHFQRAMEREIQRARRYDRQISLCLLDVDHFKAYNDTCGHQAGDRALAALGGLLRTSLREVDILARYGGEEFAVILPETSAGPDNGATNPFPFLERLRRRVEETSFPGEDKLPGGCLTISLGVACFPDDADTLDALVLEADRSLYVSKDQGRNRVTHRGQVI